MMQTNYFGWLLGFSALLGLACGSFLNVCIVRLPLGLSVVKPRSHCMTCGKPINAWQNIPILSWLFLGGRCRACSKPIPFFYPLVELAIVLWFVYCAIQFGHGEQSAIAAVSSALLGWLLIGLLVMDAQSALLPDAFTLGGGLMAVLLLAGGTISLPADAGTVLLTTPERIVLHRLLAIVIAAGSLLLVRWLYRRLRRRDGMGLGDVKMTAMLAAFLGLQLTVLAFLVACVAGSVYAAILLLQLRKKKSAKNTSRGTKEDEIPASVPFGCFLAIGGFYAVIFGGATLLWYAKFY
jgi:leader peptidase (prepilin peptidase)/N-methyltransferase